MNLRIRTRTSRGFTVLELMITVALLAILLAAAVPSFRTAIQNNRLTASSNQLLTAFQQARSEALKRKVPVSVCAADTSASTPACGSDWSEGWIVIVDSNLAGSSSAAYSGSANLLRVHPAPEGEATVGGSSAVDFVRYLPDGQIDIAAGATPPVFELRIPDCRGENARDISISRTGRARAERVECS